MKISEIKHLFKYDENSPSCLVWAENRYRRPDLKTKNQPLVCAGQRVGTINREGYWVFIFKKKNYLVHRVVWELHNGEIPEGMVINHVNCNPADNRILNLELATPQQNSRRNKYHKNLADPNNSTGVYGISLEEYWNKSSTKLHKFIRASWRDADGINKKKSWSLSNMTKEEAIVLAKEFLDKMLKEINEKIDCKSLEDPERNNPTKQAPA